MGLSPGTRFGPYEIVAPLGAGGMGEVYRARDTRLERTVAIKVLGQHLGNTPELKERFDREARAISSLNHSHICTLHDMGQQNGTQFLVMEYLEGQTLAARLTKGPLPLKELLQIGAQVCEALEAAHRAGIVHRDLKPGNIMLTKSGAKLMDFGLAKPLGLRAVGAASATAPSFTATATLSGPSPLSPLTAAGSIVGTIQYMSPEQIEGKEADTRSDVFALGAMLYEMITGRRAFEGKSQLSIASAILEHEPAPISTVQPLTPAALEYVVHTCLMKNPDDRFQSAHDIELQLKWISHNGSRSGGATTVSHSAHLRERILWFALLVSVLAALAIGYLYVSSIKAPRHSTRSSILPPEKAEFLFSNERGSTAISPDGRLLAFTVHLPEQHDMLWVRRLDSLSAQPLAGTEDAAFPFWSPDSRSIAYFAQGKLMRIDANGGPPQVLADARAGRGGSWSRDGTVVYTPDTLTGLMRVPDGGGTPTAVTQLSSSNRENSHRWPDFLPDGKHFLFYERSDEPDQSGEFVGSLDSKETRLLFRSSWPAIYAEPGYLLFPREDTLMAQSFNLRKLAVEGEAAPIAEHLTENDPSVYGVFSASQTGMLLLHSLGGIAGGSHLEWLDRNGKSQGLVTPEIGVYLHPALSPDGSRLAFSLFDGGVSDIWVLDLARGTRTRITFGPGHQDNAVWTPDGKFIFYSSTRGPFRGIFKKASDGSGADEEILGKTSILDSPLFVSPDGSYLAFERNEGRGQHVWILPLAPGFKPDARAPFQTGDTSSPFAQFWPSISPDGKWIAYSSSESGPYEIYIRPFPSGPGKWQVSTSGGAATAWRADGRELYFDTPNRQIMAVDLTFQNGSLRMGTPHVLFSGFPFISDRQGAFSVYGDGKRFILNVATASSGSQPLTLITNWDAELKK